MSADAAVTSPAFAYSEPRPGVLSLEGELTLATAREAQRVLLSALERHERLAVDFLNISKFDTAGVQLLVMLQREAATRNKSLDWLGFSVTVAETMELLQLADVLGRPGAVMWS